MCTCVVYMYVLCACGCWEYIFVFPAGWTWGHGDVAASCLLTCLIWQDIFSSTIEVYLYLYFLMIRFFKGANSPLVGSWWICYTELNSFLIWISPCGKIAGWHNDSPTVSITRFAYIDKHSVRSEGEKKIWSAFPLYFYLKWPQASAMSCILTSRILGIYVSEKKILGNSQFHLWKITQKKVLFCMYYK